jgi:hypothetical protein
MSVKKRRSTIAQKTWVSEMETDERRRGVFVYEY